MIDNLIWVSKSNSTQFVVLDIITIVKFKPFLPARYFIASLYFWVAVSCRIFRCDSRCRLDHVSWKCICQTLWTLYIWWWTCCTSSPVSILQPQACFGRCKMWYVKYFFLLHEKLIASQFLEFGLNLTQPHKTDL